MISRSGVGALVSALVLSGGAIAEPGRVLVAADAGGVELRLGELSEPQVTFELPGGDVISGRVTERDTRGEGSASWRGPIEGEGHGWFSIASSAGVAHAVIWAGELGVYELRYRADGSGLYDTVRVDTIDFPSCAGPVLPEAQQRGIPGLRERALVKQGAAEFAGGDQARGGDDGSVVDVMILYTPEARSDWGGTAAIEALAQNSVDLTNTAYANSNIGPLELRLVHTQEIAYTESGDAVTDIVALRQTNDGVMDEAHTWRDQQGADLVALFVRDFNACGIGYLAPFNAEFGFTVTDTGCAAGNLSFAHEVGHNMGATHDRDNAGGGPFDYGYGWRWNSTNGTQYRSVMAYSPGSRVTQFSNPDISFIGAATGTPDDDNARVHDETRASVAAFRQSIAPGCPADTNGDGLLSPADFNAWILAFNGQSPACDQNSDGLCTPADFNAWIVNFNAGC